MTVPTSEPDIPTDDRVMVDHESDVRFLEYLRCRLAVALKAKDDNQLIDAADVFATIREAYGWSHG